MVNFAFGSSLLFFLIHGICAKPHGTDMGKHFLIAMPRLALKILARNEETILQMTTLCTVQFQVNISSWWSKGLFEPQPLAQFNVERLKISRYYVPNNLRPLLETGKLHSIRLNADNLFYVTVTVSSEIAKLDMFTVLPVDAWGTNYYAVTYDYRPGIIVVTNEGPNKVTITLKVDFPGLFEATYKGVKYGHDDILHLELKKFEGFFISNCTHRAMKLGSLSGTHIDAVHPVGVITGTCTFDASNEFSCATEQILTKIYDQDVVLDMVSPVETWGKEFITVFDNNYLDKGVIAVISSQAETEVHVGLDTYGAFDTSYIHDEGDVLYLKIPNITSIVGDKAILVVVYTFAVCFGTDRVFVNPALFQLTPENLFLDNYVWITPVQGNTNLSAERNYVTVVRKTGEVSQIFLDGLPIKNRTRWHTVPGKTNWRVGTLNVDPGIHNIYGAEAVYFGCYVYGLSEDRFGYFESAGSMANPINRECFPSSGSVGDILDNDCDGHIDEEKFNEEDDDRDGLVDEDLSRPDRRNGNWSSWTEWACTRDCSNHKIERTRRCDQPSQSNYGTECVGLSRELKFSDCYVDDVCPLQCPLGKWGKNCTKSCIQCTRDCDKFDGVCEECKHGYQFPNESCSKECDAFRFGFRCQGDCHQKCGDECENKIDGACPGAWKTYVSVILLLLFFPTALLILRRCLPHLTFGDADSSKGETSEHASVES